LLADKNRTGRVHARDSIEAQLAPRRARRTAIEYALIAAGVSIAIVADVTAVGTQIMVVFYDKLQNLF
jgi:Flp/Fap pilin component